MANVFDQFDAAPAAPQAAPNVFDQFDAPAVPAATAPQPAAGANDWMLKYRVPGVPGISDIAKGLYDAVVGGATLPRDVYQGKVDPKSDEAVARAWDLAGVASPLSAANRGALATTGKAAAEAAGESAARSAAPSAAEVAAASQAVDIPIPRVALMPGPIQKVGAGLSDLPVVGAPLQRSAEQSLTRAQERVHDIASGMGTVSRDVAGTGLQEGINAFKTEALPKMQSEAYAPVRAAITPDAKFAPMETALALVDIQKRLANSGGQLTGEAARVSDLVKRGQLDFQALQDVRSALGRQMNDPLNRAGYDDFADARLYGALSKDLEDAVKTAGGDDLLKQWQAANATAREGQQQFKDVKALANPTTSPNSAFEQVYGLAMDRRGNLDRLVQVRKTLPPEDWANISATSLVRMGQNANEQFSPQVFVSSYDKMAPSARKILFGENAKAVDDLATSMRALQGLERFKSKSQSGNPGASAAGVAAAMHAPISTALGTTLSMIAANQLAKPATVSQVARLARSYEILVRRPSDGLRKQVDQQTNRLGVLLIEGGAAPAAANDVTRAFLDASRSVYQGTTRGAADDNQ